MARTGRQSPQSAGILLYRRRAGTLQVLLVHPGGPYWRNKDDGAWSIPKGEKLGDEDLETVARREFAEETGVAPAGQLQALGDITQKAGKRVHGFALEGDLDAGRIVSNTFELEWPPNSGSRKLIPEVDRAEWFDAATARKKIIASQIPLIERLEARLAGN